MHGRRVDGGHLVDAARQLGFEGALVVHFLGELGLAKGRLIEQLEPRARGGLAAQAHARGGQLGILDHAARHPDDSAIDELVRDLGVLELEDHRGLVVGAQSREGDGTVGAMADGAHDEHEPEQGCRDDPKADPLDIAEAAPDAQDGLEYELQAVHLCLSGT